MGEVQTCKEIERNIQILESEIKTFGLNVEDSESAERIPTHDELVKIETLTEEIVKDLSQVKYFLI